MWRTQSVHSTLSFTRTFRATAAAIVVATALLSVAGTGAATAAQRGDPAPATLDVRFGIYFDTAGTQCAGTILPGVPTNVYIVAHSAPGTEIISGAEFRFTGLPASWTVYPVPNASIFSLGNPFAGGVSLAATGTQCAAEWSTFLMYSVLVIASDAISDVQFQLVNREPPSNPNFRCPLVTDCGVGREKHCVQTSPCFVNASAPAPCTVITGVESATWSQVREFYR